MRSFLLILTALTILCGCDRRGSTVCVLSSGTFPFVIDSLEKKLNVGVYTSKLRRGDCFFMGYKADCFVIDSLTTIDIADSDTYFSENSRIISVLADYLVDCDSTARISDVRLHDGHYSFVTLTSPFTGTEGLACSLHENVNSSFSISEKVTDDCGNMTAFGTSLRFFDINRLIRFNSVTVADPLSMTSFNMKTGVSKAIPKIKRLLLPAYQPRCLWTTKAIITTIVVADGYSFSCYSEEHLTDYSDISTHPVIIGFICLII